MDLHEVESIAKQELLKHGLTTWSFAWAKTKRRQGVCKYRSRRIEIAEYYARHNPREKVLDTLMHEIAHALAGPKAGHGPAWKAVAWSDPQSVRHLFRNRCHARRLAGDL